MTHMKLGERLKSLREHNKLTQKQFAQKVCVATSTYQNYERNEREATESFLTNVVTSFGVSERWLLSGVGPMIIPQDKYGFPEEQRREIGARIKEARMASGRSEGEWAEALNVDVETYRRIEEGEEEPERRAFSFFFGSGIARNWLFYGTGEMYSESPKSARRLVEENPLIETIVYLLEDLPEEKCREILTYIEEKKLLAELLSKKKENERCGWL